MNNKTVYIYNVKQANFFFQEGVDLIEIGLGNRGDTYHKFIRDEKCEIAFTKWIDDKENVKVNMYQ